MAILCSVFKILFYFSVISNAARSKIKLRKAPGEDFEENFTAYLDQVINSTEIQSAVVFMDCVIECQDVAKRCIEKIGLPVSINSVGTVTDNILVILFEHKLFSLSSVFEKLRVVKYPTFLIVWMCPDCSIDSYHLRLHFDFFWKRNFTSVRAVVEQANSDLKLYGFYPYSQSHCGVVGPVLELEKFCSRTKKIIINDTKDDLLKVTNLHGCPLNIHARNRPPDTEIVEVAPEIYTYEGCGGLLLKTAMEKLNFTVVFNKMKPPVKRGSIYSLEISNNEDICCNDLHNQTVDIVVGTLTTLIFYKESRIELAKPIAQECFQFYTPCGVTGVGAMAWSDSFTKAFTLYTWIMIFLCAALLVMLMSKMAKYVDLEYQLFSVPLYNIFYLIGALLNIGMPAKPKSTPLRVLCAHVFFSFLIISVVFEAYVKSYRSTVSADDMNVKDLEELRRLNLKVVFTPQTYLIWNNTSEGKMGKGLKIFEVAKSGTYDDVVDRMVMERNTVIFGPSRLIECYSFNREEHKGEHQENLMSTCPVQPCVFKPHISQFIFRKGSFLVDPVNDLIQRLQETGIIQHWWAMKDPYVKRRSFKAGVVTFKEILSSIYILFVGFQLSTLVFLVELGLYHYRKIRVKYQQKIKIKSEICKLNNLNSKTTAWDKETK